MPVPKFYERLMGRLPTDDEWEVMDEAFHRHYWVLAERAGSPAGAEQLLAEWQAAGLTQSLCSLAPHEQLMPMVRTHGIEHQFLRVDGRTGPSGGGKAEQMVRHLAALEGVARDRIVVIGDAVDDAVAARARRARMAVLYTGGSHSRASLAAAGVPVVDTLAEAVRGGTVAERVAARGRGAGGIRQLAKVSNSVPRFCAHMARDVRRSGSDSLGS